MTQDYFKTRKNKYTEKLRLVLNDLPSFTRLYFNATESSNSVLTRYSYAVDIRTFFRFCVAELPGFSGKTIPDLSIEDLASISSVDIEQFLSYSSLYYNDDIAHENSERAKARKLSAIRSFLKYYHKKGLLPSNAASLVDSPKLHEKAIIRLEPNEVANLLDTVEDGNGLSNRQQEFHKITNIRDFAILSLFLGTGIRISELVGTDITDFYFEENSFLVTRKGGNREKISYNSEVSSALSAYYEQRKLINPLTGHENAFFLSIQKRRITARAVENLVEKYARIVSPLKPISPHKLRSTFGTMLYQESGDIYLVADVLGHKDVNTTRKHYAAQSEERRRNAVKYIHLRDDDSSDDD